MTVPVFVDTNVLVYRHINSDRAKQLCAEISWWDALIVAAAQASRCSILLTEDLQHDQLLGGVRVVDPFASPDTEPARIIGSLVH